MPKLRNKGEAEKQSDYFAGNILLPAPNIKRKSPHDARH